MRYTLALTAVIFSVGLCYVGVFLLLRNYPQLEFLWPTVFLANGLYVLMTVVARPLSGASYALVYALFFAPTDVEGLRIRVRLFRRLAFVLFLMCMPWVWGTAYYILNTPADELRRHIAAPGQFLIYGAGAFGVLSFICWVLAALAWVSFLIRRRRESQ